MSKRNIFLKKNKQKKKTVDEQIQKWENGLTFYKFVTGNTQSS